MMKKNNEPDIEIIRSPLETPLPLPPFAVQRFSQQTNSQIKVEAAELNEQQIDREK
jgi:hypothetical protein